MCVIRLYVVSVYEAMYVCNKLAIVNTFPLSFPLSLTPSLLPFSLCTCTSCQVTDVDESERDVYEFILTQGEIQDQINHVNTCVKREIAEAKCELDTGGRKREKEDETNSPAVYVYVL